MKRSVLFLSLLLLFNSINIITIEAKETVRKPLSLYASYFMIKEFCKVYIHSFFIDEQKIDKAHIACCKCNMTARISCLWGYAINELDEAMIAELIPLIYNGSTEEITRYLLAMYKEHQIECYACQKYNDWYIAEQDSSGV